MRRSGVRIPLPPVYARGVATSSVAAVYDRRTNHNKICDAHRAPLQKNRSALIFSKVRAALRQSLIVYAVADFPHPKRRLQKAQIFDWDPESCFNLIGIPVLELKFGLPNHRLR